MGGREEEFRMDVQADSSGMFNDQIQDLATMGLPLGSSFDEEFIADNAAHVSFPPKSDRQHTIFCHMETVQSEEGDEYNNMAISPESPPVSPTQSPKVRNREISVSELDRMQRKRREEREKKHAKLQYQALAERMKKREQSTSSNLSRLNGLAPRSSIDSNDPFIPRMNMKSLRRSLDGAPVLILPRQQSVGRLNDFFQSPDSNKFVLQFPDNPSKELNMDAIEFEDNSSLNSQGSYGDETRTCLNKISSIGLFTVQDDDSSCNLVHSSGSSNSSPSQKRNIIMLKPKKRLQRESPCSTSSSSVEYECNYKQPRTDDILSTAPYYPNEYSHDEPHGSLKSPYLTLRPKKRFITSSISGPFVDESEDIAMELNPDINLSRSFSMDASEREESTVAHPVNSSFRTHSSVSFRDRLRACRENFSFRGRTLSFHSTASQGQRNEEYADRLAMPPPSGLTRAPSCCTATSEDLLQSPSLSESNFRTPNPESARRRYWFGAPTPGAHSPMNDGLDRSSSVSSAVGLFLPRLFGTNPEDDEDFGISHRSVSTSFFGRVRDAFSTPQVSMSKKGTLS